MSIFYLCKLGVEDKIQVAEQANIPQSYFLDKFL